MPRQFSACIEMLFTDTAPEIARRIAPAADAGMAAVEFWKWTDKDLDAIEVALGETGMPLAALVAEPMIGLNDGANHAELLDGLSRSIDVARRFGAPVLIIQAGQALDGVPRDAQRGAILDYLDQAAPRLKGSGVKLGLEPLNTRVDHVGYYLDSTREGLDIVREAGSDDIGITFDLYHSAVMEECVPEVIGADIDKVFHLHVANNPGRHAPDGSAAAMKADLDWLENAGYRGPVGLEYVPAGPTMPELSEVVARLS